MQRLEQAPDVGISAAAMPLFWHQLSFQFTRLQTCNSPWYVAGIDFCSSALTFLKFTVSAASRGCVAPLCYIAPYMISADDDSAEDKAAFEQLQREAGAAE